jgi:hypothetical protein
MPGKIKVRPYPGRSGVRDRAGRSSPDKGMFSLDIITGAQNLTTLSPADLFDRERPEDVQASCKMSREWHKTNWFLETVIGLQASFYNYGLRIVPVDKKKAKTVKDWLANPVNREELERYISSVWNEWLLTDNVVSFWRKEAEVTPFLLMAETCKYSDAMGIRKMLVRLGYKAEDFKANGQNQLSDKETKRYLQNQIELSPEYDEYYEVLTRSPKGSGMGIPRLYRSFRTLSQAESMEVGESMLAYAGRLVLRFHRLGFEVKAATNAMKQTEFMWTKKRGDAIESFFRGANGFAELTGNFDHNIDYVWVDPKFYDAKKWETIIQRLMWWAGPVGFMMVANAMSPFLLGMLKTHATEERKKVGLHLAKVINQGFNLGTPVQVVWSNRCFYDQKLAWDMVKFLLQQGPLSLRTGLEQADFDPEVESERKKDEAKAERDPELLPKFDPNHGQRPGQNPGRPSGSRDGDGKAGTKPK